ncbi:DUF4347 domain-containing protein, partial [Mesonia oceanica]
MEHKYTNTFTSRPGSNTIKINTFFVVFFLLLCGISSYATGDNTPCSGEEVAGQYFIDASLPEPELLAAALPKDEAIFELFSHGRPGALLIAGNWLDAPALKDWLQENRLLQGKTQLNIYGCNFAQGEKGRAAVQYLKDELGICIAASTNITGKDGDWVLEVGNKNLVIDTYAYNLQCTGPDGDCDGDGIPDEVDLDNDNDGILDSVECGFCADPFVNGGFESPVIPSGTGTYAQTPADQVPGWETTDVNNSIEIWGDGYLGVPAAEGNQFVEINAYSNGTLYQSFCLNGRSGTVNWAIQHRGRMGVDVAAVKFGETLADAIASAPAATLTDGNTAWGSYSGTYVIPEGQTTLVIGFQAISTATGSPAAGNLIDDVRIQIIQGCIDTDGDGIVNSLDTDSDNDGCPDAIEGGAAFTAADLDANNRLIGGVDSNGVPIITDSPQAVGTSRLATQTVITSDPDDQVVDSGDPASFSITARGDETTSYTGTAPNTNPDYNDPGNADGGLNYQWYLGDPDNGGTQLSNADVYSGVTTDTLDISDTSGLYGNEYYVVVTHDDNACIKETRSAQLQLLEAAIALIKTGSFNDANGDGFAQAGETIDYTFTVENTGNATLTNITVSDTLVTVTGG